MNALDIKQLLPELKKLVVTLADDLLKRVNANADINNGLEEAFHQIEKGGRTAQAYEVWLEDYLDQVAVAWVLGCVFVRFMEDNHLIDECWLAGEGDRRKVAEDTHELFFRKHPHDTDREYFQHVFKEVGKIPAAKDLFAEGKTPLWAVAPSGDAAMHLLKFWREIDAEAGSLKRLFQVENGDTRFLGDLYQELSERAKKKFALLQTPVFVEEFILDRTLTPALDEFGVETVRMIDPTCGSGHFLLGGFARLFDLWIKRESNEIVAAQKALDGVWGVDINPLAVAIARFRLIVAAAQACGIKRLKLAPGWKIHLASGDSLLFGNRWSSDGTKREEIQYLDSSWASEIYACEDKEAVKEVLSQQYHVVVGNPPYIVVRDSKLNEAYRERFPRVCHRQYSLGVPFTERFFDVCVGGGEEKSGYVGMITANSFMKREFGKKLIEQFFAKIDLTHVIDTSGAFIPGHGTPTVILFGRNRKPVGDSVRAVLGIKGEPSTPSDPSKGSVWRSIVNHIDIANAQDAFTSTSDVSRATFASHPWSIGGGGAADLKERLDQQAALTLRDVVASIGFYQDTHADEVYVQTFDFVERHCLHKAFRWQIRGDEVRDWVASKDEMILFPYDTSLAQWETFPLNDQWTWLWSQRTWLWERSTFGGGTYRTSGRPWYDFHQFPKDRARTPMSIFFPEVASHNHFVFDKTGIVLNRTAPVVKLPAEATEVDHLALLGFLNSSAACFWMKQVSHQKQMTGGDGIRISSRAKVPFQFAGTRLLEMPVPESFVEGPLRERIEQIAGRLHYLSQEMGALTAAKVIQKGLLGVDSQILSMFREMEKERSLMRSEMVFLQEELDYTSYVIFGLADESLLCDTFERSIVQMDAGMRPFEISQGRNLDDFSVPKDVPTEWPGELQKLWHRRMEAIKRSDDLALIEDDHYKRRWLGRQGLFNHTARQDELKSAGELWLLDRLETPKYRNGTKERPEFTTTARMADVASADTDFMQVAAIYRGRADFNVAALLAELVEAEAVPFLPILRYKPTGLRKREIWERTWDLQRQQDAGKGVGDIPVPPPFIAADFLKADYWRLRGKLDVPKERWISYPHCSTDSDPTPVVGWAGWNHLEQATALVAYYDARKREGWDAKRLTPLLAGLDQLLPWIHQWHPEIDPEYGETAGQSFQQMLESDAHELGLTLDDIRAWTPESQPRKTRKSRK